MYSQTPGYCHSTVYMISMSKSCNEYNNSLAHIVTQSSKDASTTDLFDVLHWVQIWSCIFFKVNLITLPGFLIFSKAEKFLMAFALPKRSLCYSPTLVSLSFCTVFHAIGCFFRDKSVSKFCIYSSLTHSPK